MSETYRGYVIEPAWGGRFDFVHQDYDGAPDSKDRRCGLGTSVQDCKAQIDEIESEK